MPGIESAEPKEGDDTQRGMANASIKTAVERPDGSVLSQTGGLPGIDSAEPKQGDDTQRGMANAGIKTAVEAPQGEKLSSVTTSVQDALSNLNPFAGETNALLVLCTESLLCWMRASTIWYCT